MKSRSKSYRKKAGTVTGPGKRRTEARQQMQWDAFFKRLAPYSPGILSIVQNAWKLDGPLELARALSSDLPSARVAAALNKVGEFKELRSDGIFIPRCGEPAVAFEYQSTYNAGMQVRFAMYVEAFLEHEHEHGCTRVPYCALVYSGREDARWDISYHGKLLGRYLKAAFIHLGALSSDQFDHSDLEGRVLCLSHADANHIEAFKDLLADIELLRNAFGRDALARDRHATLKTALAAAAINKQTLHAWILELIAVDPELRKGLEIIVPAIVRESIAEAERSAAVDREGRELAERERKIEAERREAAEKASELEREGREAAEKARELDRELREEAERNCAASRHLAESVMRMSIERLAGLTELPDDWLNAMENADFSELKTLFDNLETITAPSGPAPG